MPAEPVPLRWFMLTLGCVALLAVGQVLFKVAALAWRVDGWSWATLRSFLSMPMLAALVIYAIATVAWVFVLRFVPLVAAYSIFSLAFIITPLFAHYALGEPLALRTLMGGAIIVVGVVVASTSSSG
jgi:drug/metabolite transporter (DMT)-like permease